MSASNRIALAILLSTVAVGCGDDESTPANGGSGGTSPTTSPVSASSTGGAGCTPGEEVPCYSGPPETAGVGVCVAGTAVCGADGMPDAETCVGEVVPTTDHCRTPADEDCDGELTECTGDHLWSKRFGDGAGQNGLGVAVDTDGNTLLYGSFDGTLDLGGPPLIGGGVFVAKLDADGNHVWSKMLAASAVPPSPRAIATDRYDNLLLIGDFSSTVDFGGGPLASSGGSEDVFVVKLDADGNHLWSKAFGDAAFQLGWGITADTAGNVLVTGEHNGAIDFGGGPLGSDPNQSRLFLAKLDEDGNHVWSRDFGASVQNVRGVTTDNAHNVVMTGYFFGSIDFGGGLLTSIGQADVFVTKLDEDGGLVWAKRFGSTTGDGSQGLTTDTSDNIVVVGSSVGAIDFGGGPLANAGGGDIFIAKLDTDGNHVWSKSFGDAADQAALDVATDPQGCVIVNGIFEGTLDFGGTPLVNAGDDDTYVVKLGIDGETLWSRAFGDSERQFGYGVAADFNGDVVVTGDLRLSIDFGGGPLTSAGDYDVFIARYAP